jgi:tRNA (uracil-5-)-methyltransferase TRM9
MDPEVLQQIRSVNKEFYQTFADSFAETRGRLQPGVLRLMPEVLPARRLLDLGCGNGEFAAALLAQGFQGNYLGIDLSERMLAIANEIVEFSAQAAFLPAELGFIDLGEVIARDADRQFRPPFDQATAFAMLHHIPGRVVRKNLMRELHHLMDEASWICLSVWNFMDSERLRARLVPWDTVGLSDEVVESDDYLIDWRRDGEGIRYVHHFSESELMDLAEQSGFLVLDTFYSDGETGTLGLYQIWEA